MKLATNENLPGCTIGYRAMLEAEFAAPVLRGRTVVVAIDEACRRVHIIPPMFQGWAVARLISPSTAIVIREADAAERQALLNQWTEVLLHVCHVSMRGVLAARVSDDGSTSIVRMHLCNEAVTPDDLVIARFDGRQYWFDQILPRDVGAVAGAASVRFASPGDVLPDLCTATFATSFPLEPEKSH